MRLSGVDSLFSFAKFLLDCIYNKLTARHSPYFDNFTMYDSFIKPFASDVKNFILDTLFPIKCVICEAPDNFICDVCKNNLTALPVQYCIACQKPSPGGLTHPNCQSRFTADALISIYDYHDENAAKLIIHGKYYFLSQIYQILGKLIAKKISENYPEFLESESWQLTPIPLHWLRQNWRGFNQSEILCKAIGAELSFETVNILTRKKHTKTQKDLKKTERVKNVASAFAFSSSFLESTNPLIAGKSYILIDDVTTTGSTLLEAAKILKQNGAKKICCLTVARD